MRELNIFQIYSSFASLPWLASILRFLSFQMTIAGLDFSFRKCLEIWGLFLFLYLLFLFSVIVYTFLSHQPQRPSYECHTYLSANDCVFYFPDGNFFTYTRHEPVGVCGQIIPVSWSPISFSGLKKKMNSNSISLGKEVFSST